MCNICILFYNKVLELNLSQMHYHFRLISLHGYFFLVYATWREIAFLSTVYLKISHKVFNDNERKQVKVGKPFTSTMRFGPERSEGPYWMASERFTNILSTWFTREIKFFVYLSISQNSFITPMISSIKF